MRQGERQKGMERQGEIHGKRERDIKNVGRRERERVWGKWVNEELSNEWRYRDGIRERMRMRMRKMRRDPDRLLNRRD